MKFFFLLREGKKEKISIQMMLEFIEKAMKH